MPSTRCVRPAARASHTRRVRPPRHAHRAARDEGVRSPSPSPSPSRCRWQLAHTPMRITRSVRGRVRKGRRLIPRCPVGGRVGSLRHPVPVSTGWATPPRTDTRPLREKEKETGRPHPCKRPCAQAASDAEEPALRRHRCRCDREAECRARARGRASCVRRQTAGSARRRLMAVQPMDYRQALPVGPQDRQPPRPVRPALLGYPRCGRAPLC